jgi:hypothetical protein
MLTYSDNLRILDYPELEGLQFVIVRDGEEWIVFLGRPGRVDSRPKGSKLRRVYDASTYKGRGLTPDLAYLDLLGHTADELSIRYGFFFEP